MKIDKRNDHVCYNDEAHVYWQENTGNKFISVTTLIGKFENEFDKEFWSLYKALERGFKEEFKMEKRQLLDTKKFDLERILEYYSIDEEELLRIQKTILEEWAEENRKSCELGTAIHAKLEEEFSQGEKVLPNYGSGGKFPCIVNDYKLTQDKGVFPELLIYWEDPDEQNESKKLLIAGQVDRIIKDGNKIYITDYKTNKKIDESSYQDKRTKKKQVMKYPLNNLDDCNKIHYTLQLSLYAWMLQQYNPEFEIELLELHHYDRNMNLTVYPVEYMKDEVERMIKFYKQQKNLEESKKKRKPIIF